MLRADNVSFAYHPGGRAVLSTVSVAVDRGEIVGILGPNGSGKTTLLKVLAGVLQPQSGRILLNGRPLDQMPRRHIARHLAMVPQETHLAFDYSVLELVLMGRYPHLGTFELEGPSDVAIARAALAATGTGALAERLFTSLSGGEKQRVVIASALAQSAELLLLDEPTASLDLGYQLEIAGWLATLNRERGVTMVLCTHDLNFAATVCRRLILLRDGAVLAAGPTNEVLTADAIRRLYDIDADVRFHDAAGHLTVVPLARTDRRPSDGTGGRDV